MSHTALATPVTVNGPYGPITCTHEDFGCTWQDWNETAIVYRVVGIEQDGKFVPVPNNEYEKNVPLDAAAETKIRAELARVIAAAG